MWFDAQAALAEIQKASKHAFGNDQGAKHASCANSEIDEPPRLAQVARLARSAGQSQNVGIPSDASATADRKTLAITPSASDPDTYLAYLRSNGPATYGAVAVALGWGATRAWQAEARLRAKGRVSVK